MIVPINRNTNKVAPSVPIIVTPGFRLDLRKLSGTQFSVAIFDLDGTLVGVRDIKKHADDVLKRALSRVGVGRTTFKDRYEFFFCGAEYVNLLEQWGITSEKQRRSFVEALSAEEYAEKKRLMERGSARLYKDAEILSFLKGKVKLGLVTNASSQATSLEVKYLGIEQCFDCIVSLGDFANHLPPKPDPSGISYCLKTLNEPPSKAIVIGDNLTDVIAGERSGAKTAIILRGRERLPKQKGQAQPRIDFTLEA